MYTNYNIPQKSCCKPQNFTNSQNYMSNMSSTYPSVSYSTSNLNPNSYTTNYGTTTYNDGDRFFGGGFLAPFLLGGVGGYLLGRPNYNNFGPGPIPVYFPPGPPAPYPVPYSNTNIYY